MSWSPNDLVSDVDLLAYERQIKDQFNVDDWQDRRQKAIEDWLFPYLEAAGFDPQRFRTRFIPTSVLGYTSSAFTDKTSAAETSDGLNLASILAASSDALYVGFTAPFRGLSFRVHDSASSGTGTLGMTVWADGWTAPQNVCNQTLTGSTVFGKGGAITWTLPETTVRRLVNSVGPYYWAKLTMTSAPTGLLAGPITVIRRSRLCAPVTLRTLALIFREAPISQDGPWRDKAAWYEAEAERAWLRVCGQIGGEFDSDDDDAISATEAQQTAESVNGGGWRLERC